MLSRVLHVTPSFFPATRYGGPVVALYDLCRAQLHAGLKVRVLTSDAAGKKDRLAARSGGGLSTDYGVPTLYGRTLLGEDIAPELLWAIFREVAWADLVHVTGLWSPTSLLGILGAVGRRRPCVVSPRGTLLPWALRRNEGRKRLSLRLLGGLLRRVVGWHATSPEEAAAIRGTPGLVGSSATVAVVPNGVAVPSLHPPFFASPVDAPIIMTLGRLHPVKNLELALDAFSLLRRSLPRATLRIVGPLDQQPRYVAMLRDKVAALALGEAVQFPGEVVGEAKLAALRGASLLWLCSHMESFGNVVLEALAAGTPVVAAQTTPWHELSQLGGGRCVPATAEAFVEASRALLPAQATEPLREGVARRCQAVVRERFSFPAVESQMRALYEQALRAGARFE
jgi:glycosyltransferase involved in cell wall biosynthesis